MAILISTKGNSKLILEIYTFEFPKAKTPEDEGWMIGNLKFENPCFIANIENRSQFYLSEMTSFVQNLEKIINNGSGSISYQGTEPYLTLTVKFEQTGSVQINGKIWDVDHNSGTLSFEFESDQTCVRQFCKELKEALADFNSPNHIN